MLFLLFVHVVSPWHVYEGGVDVSLGLWDSCESQDSAEMFGLMEKSYCCIQETTAQGKVGWKWIEVWNQSPAKSWDLVFHSLV